MSKIPHPHTPSRVPLRGPKTYSASQVAKRLSVGLSRSTQVVKMAEELRLDTEAASRGERRSGILDRLFTWRNTHTKKLLSPTYIFCLITAAKVAAKLLELDFKMVMPDEFVWRRAKRRAKKAMALYRPHRAYPLTLKSLKLILEKTTCGQMRASLWTAWQMGLRIGSLKKITAHRIRVDEKRKAWSVRVVGWKTGDLGLQNRVKVAALHRHNRYYVEKAHQMNKHDRVFPTSAARIIAHLKRFNPRYSGHSVRRGAATHLASKGVSLRKISLFLLHKHVDVTRLYIKQSFAQLASRKEVRLSRKLHS